MTSPTDRTAQVAPAGGLRPGEFWVSNPWQYPADQNLSAYEPNRLYLNRGSMSFLEASYLSGAGSDGDGRGALVADVNGDLQPDLIVRHSGGGPIRIFLNAMPKKRRLTVRLAGTRSNSRGIGARVAVEAGGRRLVRQVWANNSFVSQSAPRARFGLGNAAKVDKLTVYWPSGSVTTLGNVDTNRVLVVREGD